MLQYKSYDAMQSIIMLLQLFYTITINFILVLSTFKSFNQFNINILITDKFSKTIILIFNYKTMTDEN